jgi:carbonic anhydrase
MVLGHERCGAVDAAVKGAQVPGQIGSLLAAIKPGVEKSQS